MSDFDFGKGADGNSVDYDVEHRSYVDDSDHDSYTDKSTDVSWDDNSTNWSHDGDIDDSYNTSFEGDHSFNTTEINHDDHSSIVDLDHAVDFDVL